MVAGLTKRERAALKALGGGRRTGPGGGFLGEGSADPSLEWAGMAADLLERKRKEDDRRRTVEEKKRFRETRTAIGARDWHTDMVAGQDFVEAAQPRLPASTWRLSVSVLSYYAMSLLVSIGLSLALMCLSDDTRTGLTGVLYFCFFFFSSLGNNKKAYNKPYNVRPWPHLASLRKSCLTQKHCVTA